MSYLESYLERIKQKGNPALADAIRKTVDDVVPSYISNFSFTDHVVSLLVGDVQSGKTSHMFGLMCAAADESFLNFVLLTTDNILLQQQTLKRAQKDLCDFCMSRFLFLFLKKEMLRYSYPNIYYRTIKNHRDSYKTESRLLFCCFFTTRIFFVMV